MIFRNLLSSLAWGLHLLLHVTNYLVNWRHTCDLWGGRFLWSHLASISLLLPLVKPMTMFTSLSIILPTGFLKNMAYVGHADGSVCWASAFGSHHGLRVLGLSPTMRTVKSPCPQAPQLAPHSAGSLSPSPSSLAPPPTHALPQIKS